MKKIRGGVVLQSYPLATCLNGIVRIFGPLLGGEVNFINSKILAILIFFALANFSLNRGMLLNDRDLNRQPLSYHPNLSQDSYK